MSQIGISPMAWTRKGLLAWQVITLIIAAATFAALITYACLNAREAHFNGWFMVGGVVLMLASYYLSLKARKDLRRVVR